MEEEVGSVPRDQASSIDDVAERAFSYDDDLLIPKKRCRRAYGDELCLMRGRPLDCVKPFQYRG